MARKLEDVIDQMFEVIPEYETDDKGVPQEPKFEKGSWEEKVFNIWMNL